MLEHKLQQLKVKIQRQKADKVMTTLPDLQEKVMASIRDRTQNAVTQAEQLAEHQQGLKEVEDEEKRAQEAL